MIGSKISRACVDPECRIPLLMPLYVYRYQSVPDVAFVYCLMFCGFSPAEKLKAAIAG